MRFRQLTESRRKFHGGNFTAKTRPPPCTAHALQRHPLCVTRHASPVMRHPSCVTRHAPPVLRHPACVTRHASLVMRHTLYVARYASHVMRLPPCAMPLAQTGPLSPTTGATLVGSIRRKADPSYDPRRTPKHFWAHMQPRFLLRLSSVLASFGDKISPATALAGAPPPVERLR